MHYPTKYILWLKTFSFLGMLGEIQHLKGVPLKCKMTTNTKHYLSIGTYIFLM
jgi:hypothetical protein